jgi:hypothetical protein
MGLLISLVGGGLWWMIVACVLAASHCHRSSVVNRRALVEWVIRRAHRRQLLRATALDIPSSVDFSTTEKCTWLATVLEQLWPFAKVALEQMLRNVLDPILADAAERLGLGLSLGFRQLQLGRRPPLITGVNTLRTAAGVSIDLTLQLAGGSDVVVEAKARGVAVSAELSNLMVRLVLCRTSCQCGGLM